MSYLTQLYESSILRRLVGLDEEKVKNAFFSNYLSALLMLKIQDIKGLMIINDRAHSKLTRFNDSMSDLNFWGRTLFYPKNQEVKSRLLSGHADVLAAEAGRIMDSRIQWMMHVPLTAPEHVNWIEVIASLVLLRHRFGIQSSYFKNILFYLANWEKIRESEKKRAINQAFMYMLQSDPKSSLLPRLRALQTNVMLKKVVDMSQTIVGFKRISENEIVSPTVAAPADTSAGNIASAQSTSLQGLFRLDKIAKNQVTKNGKYVYRDNKIIKKKAKKFKAMKFKAPKSFKIRATNGSGDE